MKITIYCGQYLMKTTHNIDHKNTNSKIIKFREEIIKISIGTEALPVSKN